MNDEAKLNIQTFKAVCKAIGSSDSLDMMANTFAQLMVATLNIKACALFVLDLETKELVRVASYGLSAKYMSKGPVLANKSIAANLRGEPVIVADVSKDKNIQYPQKALEEGITSILSIPIVFNEGVLGVLRLYDHEIWHLSDQDLDTLGLLAHNIGLAMTYISLRNAVSSIEEVIHTALPVNLRLGLQSV